MSFPTVFSPWYAVLYLSPLTNGDMLDAFEVLYYAADDGREVFLSDPKKAMLFTSLLSASRVAAAESSIIRVLTNKQDIKDFGRDQ